MKEILLEQWKHHPEMEITDAVKLLYQSEFGGGHMVSDPQKSLEFLKKEWNTVKTSTGECCGTPSPVCEYIGNGMYRMHLQAFSEGLSPETMNQMFLQSAANKKGTMESFKKKLEQFLEWCRMGELPFAQAEAEEYLKEYQKKGYPAVSHSPAYKKAYHPAYRVVEERFAQYYPVLCCIDRRMKEKQKGAQFNPSQLLIAIDGMCGSGKTTLGQLLQSVYDCNLFHMDDFFLRPEQRTPERMAQVGGNVDYERFQKEILNHICQQEGLSYRIYDCKSQTLGSPVFTPWKCLNIIEGSYSQHPYFGDVYDLRFFCEICEEEQLLRIRRRNGDVMAERFRKEWIPRENRYFEAFSIREKSQMVNSKLAISMI